MMDQPKVSIIVPIYNVEKYLDRCMHSLLNQTLKEVEIILVDDESPDNCPAMCDQYARQDDRIKVIHKKNGGLGFARNSGLEIATGEYIAFVDSDDFVAVEMYERMYHQSQYKNLDLLFCNYYYYKEKEVKVCLDVYSEQIFNDSGQIRHLLFDMIGTLPQDSSDRKFTMSVWHGIYKRSILEASNIRFISEREIVSEDMFFHIEFMSRSKRIGYLPDCYYYYCENGVSLSKSYRKDRYEKYVILHHRAIDLLSTIYPEKRSEIKLRVDRLFIGYVRNMLLVYKNPKELYQNILKDSFLHAIINNYPYNKLAFKHRLFIYLLKYRCGGFIRILNKS